MGKYIKVEFDAKYNIESSVERYERLCREVKPKLAACLVGLREQLSNGSIDEAEKEKCIAHYKKQADDLLLNIQDCWRFTHSKDCSVPRFQSAINAELYLIETLARIGVIFENPTDAENTKQLLLLAQEIPGDAENNWHALKYSLIALATVAVGVLAALSLGPAAPAGLVLLVIFLPNILGSALMMRELVNGGIAARSQPVKSGIDSIVKGNSFFAPTDSPNESIAGTKKSVLETELDNPVNIMPPKN